MDGLNEVQLSGKVTRAPGLRYTPAGIPVLEFILAVPQETTQKKTIGYFDIQVEGVLAEEIQGLLKIGSKIKVAGSLWMRRYKNRQGVDVFETKVRAKSVASHQQRKEEK